MFVRFKYGGNGLPYNYSEFLCESETDMSGIDISKCSVGSKSLVFDGYGVYILDNTMTWVLFNNDKSDSGSISDDEIATTQELINYINS